MFSSQQTTTLELQLHSNIKGLPSRLIVNGLFIATGQLPETGFLPKNMTTEQGYLKHLQLEQPQRCDAYIALSESHPFSLSNAAAGVKTAMQLREQKQLSAVSGRPRVTIIGESSGAFTAALYAARDNMDVTLVDTHNPVPDYLFWPDRGRLYAATFRQQMIEQVEKAGVHYIVDESPEYFASYRHSWLTLTKHGPVYSHFMTTETQPSLPENYDNVRTDQDGIFVAGDAVENSTKQAVSAAASGARAAKAAQQWLQNHPSDACYQK